MSLNLKKPLIVFDLETTGLDLVKDRIIQLSYIKVFPDGKEERENLYINPEREIPHEVEELTGITNEEFLRAGIDFDFSKCRLIDAQNIYHKMERRNLAAAYEFYCGRKMEDDFTAHKADEDTEATWRVLQGQIKMYSEEKQKDPERILKNDMDELAKFSQMNDNVDFAGRIVWKDVIDKDGNVLLDENGCPRRHEVFNFGKYRGWDVAEVLHRDPGFYSWMLASDFTYNTKQVLTRIRLREFNNR